VITNEGVRIQAEKTQNDYIKMHDASMPIIIIPRNIHKCGIVFSSLFSVSCQNSMEHLNYKRPMIEINLPESGSCRWVALR
jgi:hypothetical protein